LLDIGQGRRYGRRRCASADIALEAFGGQKESLRLLKYPRFTLVHTTSLLLVELHGHGSKAADAAHADLPTGSSSVSTNASTCSTSTSTSGYRRRRR